MTDRRAEFDRNALALDVAVDEPPQKLWRALTQPRLVERWLAPVVERSHDPARGRPADGLTCQLIETDEGRSASYIWRDPEAGASIVTFSISERADGFSRLSVIHSGLSRGIVAMSGAPACRIAFSRLCSHSRNLNPVNVAGPLLMAA